MLTQKQEQFCLNLVQDMPQREAYIKAGYSSKMLPATIDHNASVLASTNKILARVAELRSKAEAAAVKVKTAYIMNEQERRERLSEIANARLTDYMELGQDGSWVNIGQETPNGAAIQEIHSRTQYDDKGASPTVYTSVKLHDPIKAIDLLNKMDKLYSEGTTNNVNIVIIREVEVRLSEGNVGHIEAKPTFSLPLPESIDEKGV